MSFLEVRCPELAIARVRQRVREGGHNVPDDVIRRRFQRASLNFDEIYKRIVDEWAIYDNSGKKPLLINEGGVYE